MLQFQLQTTLVLRDLAKNFTSQLRGKGSFAKAALKYFYINFSYCCFPAELHIPSLLV